MDYNVNTGGQGTNVEVSNYKSIRTHYSGNNYLIS